MDTNPNAPAAPEACDAPAAILQCRCSLPAGHTGPHESKPGGRYGLARLSWPNKTALVEDEDRG